MNKVTYIKSIAKALKEVSKKNKDIVFMGENINKGSCLSGLTREISNITNSNIINVGNCELTHVGVGLGIMMGGGSAVLCMKQQDFMYLALDQIANTFNYIRSFNDEIGSFSIIATVCDQGYQGPQSSANIAGDIMSMTGVPVYSINSASDVKEHIEEKLCEKGFRLICLSQKEYNMPIIENSYFTSKGEIDVKGYQIDGNDVTIIAYGLCLRDALCVSDMLKTNELSCDLFHVQFVNSVEYKQVIESIKRTGRLIIIDDTKSINKFGDQLIVLLNELGIQFRIQYITRRGLSDAEYSVSEDKLQIDYDKVLEFSQRLFN